MAEKASGSPKRTPRPRRRPAASVADSHDENLAHDVAASEQPPRAAIHEAFEEAAAARAEIEAPPTERDMDFDDVPPPPRARATRERRSTRTSSPPRDVVAPPAEAFGIEPRGEAVEEAPVTRAPRARRGEGSRRVRTAESERTSAADASSVEESHRASESRGSQERDQDARGSEDRGLSSRQDLPSSRQESPGRSSARDQDDFGFGEDLNLPNSFGGGEEGGNQSGDAEQSGFESGPEDGGRDYVGGDDPNRRRRRRRRRGGRNNFEGQNTGAGTGGQGGFKRGPQQNQRRGGPQGGGQQQGPRRHGGNQPRGDRGGNDRSAMDRQGPPRADLPGAPVIGILELHPKGYGFLRDQKAGYFSQDSDAFVSSSLIQKFNLREGVVITGEAVSGGRGQGPRLRQIDTIEGRTPDAYQEIKSFDELTPVTPFCQIKLETGPTPITMRVMDLLTPIAKGQRALLVAPPRSGKTMLLQEIADSVSKNHPEVYLMVLLIDERPEEVTEMKRRVRGEVIASSLDREVENHIRVSQLVFERAKRMTESGRDVFVLLDSITRTARAFNKWSNSGRTGTGGLDIRAMDIPKKMFGTARQFEEGGSLTIVGTALVETGSRMDDAIFQEFKGTGNMELVLSRDLADRRIWPAIDITRSGTRREEKIYPPEILESVTLLRRSLISLSPVEAMEQLTRTLLKFSSNQEFLAKVKAVM